MLAITASDRCYISDILEKKGGFFILKCYL